jgi:hypothetical protein
MSIMSTIRHMVTVFKQRLQGDIEKDSGMYWQLSRQDSRIQDQSHWCGVRRWDRDRWLEHGTFHYDLIMKYMRSFAGPASVETFHRQTALEWGCGGGANVRLLCENFRQVYGVEVSEASLDECQRQMGAFGFGNFRPVFFPSEKPESVLDMVGPETIDVILSTAVFQHFPSKEYTQRVLAIMESLLKKEAYALIQVRYFDGSEKLRQKDSDYSKNVVYMTSFTPGEFSEQVRNAGLTVLVSERDIDNVNDCHEYFFIRK